MAVNPIYIPTFIGSITYAPVRVLPHIYFYNGTKDTNTYFIGGYGATTSSLNIVSQSAFPYFDNYSGNTPTTESLSLLFNNEAAVYGQAPTASLYTTYWEKYISLLYNPRTRLINCEGIIPLANYFKMELNDIVEWRGNYYHLRAINDYNLKNGECKIQLLGPILEDVITNILPELVCNFTFTQIVATPTTTTSTTTLAPQTLNIDYLIVAGGGGGGFAGGGGGAGGLLSGSLIVNEINSYPITIGLAGRGGINNPPNSITSSNGGNSTAFSLTAIGGGAGGNYSSGINTSGSLGGSGGGGGCRTGGAGGGSGSVGQGNRGGRSINVFAGAGGGGASSEGTNSRVNFAGNGGSGSQWLDGNFYAGGGGGGGYNYNTITYVSGSGGIGGGANGADGSNNNFNALNATGYGAGGGGGCQGVPIGNGSSGSAGIVIVRYPGTVVKATGGTITSVSGYTYHTFTANGTFALIPTPTTTTTLAPTTTTLAPTTTTTLAPTTTTTTISASCSTWQITNSSPSLGGQVTYVPCSGAGYRDQFIPVSSSITLCVQNGQIQNVAGYASSSLTNLSTSCTSSLQNCISYTISNSGGTQYSYSGKNCSNCATQLFNINAGQTVVRCFVSGTFTTSFPTFVTATAGANCNVSGSGCPI